MKKEDKTKLGKIMAIAGVIIIIADIIFFLIRAQTPPVELVTWAILVIGLPAGLFLLLKGKKLIK